jgi:hypothetical protein
MGEWFKCGTNSKRAEKNWATVDLWLERWSTDGSIRPRKMTGRPVITTADEEADIVLSSLERPFENSQDIKSRLNLIFSHKTIDRVLKAIGINRHFAARKFQLIERHKLIRYQFCKAYFNWNSNQWSDIVFTGIFPKF